jgi:hypothetical protein
MRLSVLLLLATGLAVRPAAAFTHEKGVIRLGAEEVAAGTELEVRGEKLPKRTEFTLVLRGALETHTLGKVTTDTLGAFVARVLVPAAAQPGAYVVRALAPDGDESARAELRVLAAAAAVAATEDHGGAHGHGEGAEAGHATSVEATAEPLDLPVRHGPLGWAVILGVSAGCLVSGLALLRQARGAPEHATRTG